MTKKLTGYQNKSHSPLFIRNALIYNERPLFWSVKSVEEVAESTRSERGSVWNSRKICGKGIPNKCVCKLQWILNGNQTPVRKF